MKFNASYLAGLFDGEGCIFIGKRSLVRLTVPQYHLSASINMVHRPLIDALAEQLDCYVIIHRKDLKNPKHRAAYEIIMGSNRARDFLLSIFDELVVKKEEARLAIMFQNHLNEYRRAIPQMSAKELQALMDYREVIRLKVKALKRSSFLGASDWNADEFGEHPMPGLFGDAEGQYRAKQELTTPGVCNEQVSAPKGRICSALDGNIQNAAEMTASHGLKVVA